MSRESRVAVCLLAGNALSSLGTGLTLPYLFVYLHLVRGYSAGVSSLLIATAGIVGFCVSPAVGYLIDRIGPPAVILGASIFAALGDLVLSFAASVPVAAGAIAIFGVGTATIWPALSTLLARLLPTKQAQRAFSAQFMLLNAGIGGGAALSAFLVDVNRLSSFQQLYRIDAASFALSTVALLATIGATFTVPDADTDAEAADARGYRSLLRDRQFVRLCVFVLIAVGFGYGQFEVGLPALVTLFGHLDPATLGPALTMNTVAVVGLQLWVSRFAESRSALKMLKLAVLIWAVAWAAFIPVVAGANSSVAIGSIFVGLFVYAIGETLFSPMLPTFVNQIAPSHLQGRYNATSAACWSLGMIGGPLIAGLLITIGSGIVYLSVVVIGCLAGLLVAGRPRPEPAGAAEIKPTSSSVVSA